MIEGSQVRLRAVERADLGKFQQGRSDLEAIEGLTQYRPLSMDDEERCFGTLECDAPEQRPLAIEVRSAAKWRLAGNTRLFHLEWLHRSTEFGSVIGDKTLWDRGYFTEALELMLAQGWVALKLNRNCLHLHATNRRARRSCGKTGFVVEGTLRRAMFRRGRYVDTLGMGSLLADWQKRREGA